MKKQVIILIILISVLGFFPVNFSFAITQNQINAEVQIVCTDGVGNWFSGSGTIIDPTGIILTNRHVIEGAYKNTCIIGIIKSINQEPDFGTSGNYNLAEVKYYTSTDEMDAAILYLDNPTNKSYPYVNIWDSNSDNLQFGEKIETIGFPSIGGGTVTYTSGDFSGYGSANSGTKNYIKSTAPVEHGNSGGAAYDSIGQFIGIPTMVVVGSLNSISYILSVNSIKNWLSNTIGNQYQKQITEQKAETYKDSSIQNDITPPDYMDIIITNKMGLNCNPSSEIEFSADLINKNCSGIIGADPSMESEYNNFSLKIILNNLGASGLYFYLGNDSNVIPAKDNTSSYIDLTKINPTKSLFDEREQNWTQNSAKYNFSKTYLDNYYFIYNSKKLQSAGSYYLIIQAVDKNNNFSERKIFNYMYTPKISDSRSDFLLPDSYKIYTGSNKTNLIEQTDKNFFKEVKIPSNTFYMEWSYKEALKQKISYTVKLKEKLSSGEFNEWTKGADHNCKNYYSGIICEKTYLLNTTSGFNVLFNYLEENKKYYLFIEALSEDLKTTSNPLTIVFDHSYVPKINKSTEIYDSNLSKRLSGRILLQVERHGEAYYIYPKDSKRYYMADGDEAYRIMRYLGVGITDKDLAKINGDKNFAKKNSGKIFLQVEARGEAYYIDFNGNIHYLKDGSAAYTIMRELGLGITNNDLSKIPEGSL